MPRKTHNVSIYMDDELFKRVDRLATREDRARSNWIVRAIELCADRQDAQIAESEKRKR